MGKNGKAQYLSTVEAANKLGVHPRTVRTWAKKGGFGSKPFGHYRFTAEEVENYPRIGATGSATGDLPLAQLRRLQRQNIHVEAIRQSVKKLKGFLDSYPPVESLKIDDLKKGELRLFSDMVLRWMPKGQNYILSLDKEYEQVAEHLGSGGYTAISNELVDFCQLAGKCTKECHYLLTAIKKIVNDNKKMAKLSAKGERGPSQGFYWSIFEGALSDNFSLPEYVIASEKDNLQLLIMRDGHNLGWFARHEVKSVEQAHQFFTGSCRKWEVVGVISGLQKKMNSLRQNLSNQLDEIGNLDIIPGKCQDPDCE